MKKFILRLFYGLLFALPLMMVTFALARAQEGQPAQAQTDQKPVMQQAMDCSSCHTWFQDAWETSAHGKATTDPAFKKEWEAQGKPSTCLSCHVTGYNAETNTWVADGITCQACHDTAAANHPQEPMAADRSANLCGNCHTETYFEWQASKHRQVGLDCVGCHDPHGTTLIKDNASAQCASCHRERSSNFAHSQHSKQGLTCADCHLATLTDPNTEGHARLDHSFNVQLSTCNQCHAYQMHDPSEVHTDNPTPQPVDALASVESLSVAPEPQPVSPVGYATISGLFGLGLGIILAPWLERRGRKNREKIATEVASKDKTSK